MLKKTQQTFSDYNVVIKLKSSIFTYQRKIKKIKNKKFESQKQLKPRLQNIRERQISYDCTYMWNLRSKTDELLIVLTGKFLFPQS